MAGASPLVPDARGRFGPYGGRYVPETLMYALEQLTEQYESACQDAEFQEQLAYYLRQYVGRPSPLYYAERLTQEAGVEQGFSSSARTSTTLERTRSTTASARRF